VSQSCHGSFAVDIQNNGKAKKARDIPYACFRYASQCSRDRQWRVDSFSY